MPIASHRLVISQVNGRTCSDPNFAIPVAQPYALDRFGTAFWTFFLPYTLYGVVTAVALTTAAIRYRADARFAATLAALITAIPGALSVYIDAVFVFHISNVLGWALRSQRWQFHSC